MISSNRQIASAEIALDGPDGIYEVRVRIDAETNVGEQFQRERTLQLLIHPCMSLRGDHWHETSSSDLAQPSTASMLDAAVRHVAEFARMIKDLSGDENTLTKWIGAVDADLPALRSFTAGLRRDQDAVVAGLTMRYNSGAVEGTVNRIKQLKAAMYGRAKPDLHRKLILLA